LKLWRYAIIFSLVFPLLAQEPAKPDQPKPDQPKPDAAKDAAEPPELPPRPVPVQEETPAEAQYGGPAILSRGGTSTLRIPTESIRIRPFATVNANYDTGITPVVVTPKGAIPNDSSLGFDVSAGLYGYHRWKSATLGVDYKGSYRDYIKNTYYNGTDQSLSLIYTKQALRHLSYTLRESAGLFSQNFFTAGPYNLVDATFANTPTNDIFDGRTLYLNTMGDVTYQATARLSFNMGGDGFVVRRRSSSLYGVTGYRARGDMAYRTSRYATSGVAYDFTHFEYTKGFGGSDIHTLAFTQAFRIGRYWELSMRAGGSRVETLGLIQVAIDPVIAAIIGTSQGIQVIYRVNWVPSANVLLTRKFHYSTLSFSYDRGVIPGNGVYLTSRQESFMGSFSYTGLRKTNIGVSGGHTSFGSLTQTVGNYSGSTGGAGLTYKISGPFHFIARFDYRRYDIAASVFRRDSYRASLGFGFSPKDVPLSLW
jgi:hypothetical protein